MRGRPLRFLAVVLSGWTLIRATLLWPGGERPRPIPAALARMPGTVPPRPVAVPHLASGAALPSHPSHPKAANAIGFASPTVAPALVATPSALQPAARAEPIVAAISRPTGEGMIAPGLPPIPPPVAPRPRTRWSGSAWAIARDGGGNALLSPLLGGSQAGLRIAFSLDRAGRAAAYARTATPLDDGPAEIALGGQWRPGRPPVTIYAEARASDGRVAPAAGVFGGGATPVTAGFRLEGYGQAGVIDRDGLSGFADGQLRLVRAIGGVDVGVGTWGAAQRGAARLDIGPSIGVPIRTRPLTLRVTLDWRQRIAGDARPRSGPALALGADF